MSNFICTNCGKEFTTLLGLSRHNAQKHNINAKETYVIYICNGETPVCNCGCGGETNFIGVNKGFNDYIHGHASRVNNNWGNNPDVIKKSHETQKKMHQTGELTIWNKGLTKETDNRVKLYGKSISNNTERGLKISKALSNVPKSETHKKNLSKAQIKLWDNEEKREKQRIKKINYLKQTNFKDKKTNLESEFESILLQLGVNYEYQFEFKHYHFDFYLMDYNILIEVDGDFFHCNPNTKHKEPKYPIQEQTVRNDKKKNALCLGSIQLERFWEYDINNHKDKVIKRLMKLII